MAEPIAIGAILQSVKALKVAQAQQGTKTFSKPKTLAGKLFGGISGRTAGFTTQEEIKKGTIMASMNDARKAAEIPVTGGISFGGQAAKATYLPFAIVAAVVAIFYAMRRKKGNRRRY